MPTWNETRVRVEGFSNSSATLRSASGRGPAGAGALQLHGALDERSELRTRKLGAGDEVARIAHGGILGGQSGGAGPASRARRGRTSLRRLRSLVPDRREPVRAPGALRVLSWNLFHGRDFPPDPALRTAALACCCARTTHNDTHVQVNRSLYEEFAGVLARRRLGRLPAPGVPAPVGRPARGASARRRLRSAHLAQLARCPAQRDRGAQPGPDGLVGGRLEPHARAPAVADRRGRVGAAEPAAGAAPARAAAAAP